MQGARILGCMHRGGRDSSILEAVLILLFGGLVFGVMIYKNIHVRKVDDHRLLHPYHHDDHNLKREEDQRFRSGIPASAEWKSGKKDGMDLGIGTKWPKPVSHKKCQDRKDFGNPKEKVEWVICAEMRWTLQVNPFGGSHFAIASSSRNGR